MILPIALTTAGAAALINAWLAMRVGRVRMSEKVMLGDGGNERLIGRMRAHANFNEFTPIVLILIALIEFAQGTSIWLWIAAVLFLIGRVFHGLGMDGLPRGRMIGAVTAMLITIGLGLYAAALPYWTAGTITQPTETTPVETVPMG
jgi:uncharacterized protein